MKPIHEYIVCPSLPENLRDLLKLAYNLRWAWNKEAINLFRRLDNDLWETTGHNPMKMLGLIKQEKLEKAQADDGFIAHLERVSQDLERYQTYKSWYEKTYGKPEKPQIAYFSFEFGITECIPIYSGGLGILAGDHLKSSSDLGLPLVGVGLFYQGGYFEQYLSAEGWQQERYPKNDFFNMPIQLVKQDDKSDLTIEIGYPDGPVFARIWKAQVGNVPLFLLDTNISQNRPEDQQISAQLYGGDGETRIRQEILLGIGGIRALKALEIEPVVCHMNEGHAAFLALERIHLLMKEKGLSFETAKEAVTAGNIFTTHTPVPAGHDVFSIPLMEKYFRNYYPQLGFTKENFPKFLDLGREEPGNPNENFCMTVLALRLAAGTNGVSKLHGEVSRKMWQKIWPCLPPDEIPITSITNGIHPSSWISHEMGDLFDRYLGPRWQYDPSDPEIWKHVSEIPDEELWRTHARRRERLVAYVRRQLKTHLLERGKSSKEVTRASEVLNPEALTIGFARRFATYKRATLIFKDPDRLAAILCNKQYPVQIIFAGKAHPKDNEGKDLIRQIIHYARSDQFRNRVVFIEDYELPLARYMVQGVDIWLNNPRKLLEASGTSGMKASFNGALNLSVLDGWWYEAFSNETGWAIGKEEEYEDLNYQDEVESKEIYDMLEKEIVPLFYNRGADSLPRGWTAMMKSMMQSICPQFNTNRMAYEYNERFYQPLINRYQKFTADNFAMAKATAVWKSKLYKNWGGIKINYMSTADIVEQKVGNSFKAHASISLGNLDPEDVSVELYNGLLDPDGTISSGKPIPMTYKGHDESGNRIFVCEVPCLTSGRHGYTLRIMPKHAALHNPYETCLIKWEE
ncbi:MAG: alpha-glucan family phosphorylase [Proteobacteria bacterium]|nr:alpha-glucan family phosphorylase [Pseudomonadota bacterium]